MKWKALKWKALFLKDMWSKSVKELVDIRKTMKNELFSLKSKNSVKWLKETHKIGDIKVKIARINTLLTHKIKENYGDNMK